VATRKQKREQMAARRAAFEQKVKQDGLKAQARDREYRQRKAKKRAEAEEAEKRRKDAVAATNKLKQSTKDKETA
jgi:hypothetical protein